MSIVLDFEKFDFSELILVKPKTKQDIVRKNKQSQKDQTTEKKEKKRKDFLNRLVNKI